MIGVLQPVDAETQVMRPLFHDSGKLAPPLGSACRAVAVQAQVEFRSVFTQVTEHFDAVTCDHGVTIVATGVDAFKAADKFG